MLLKKIIPILMLCALITSCTQEKASVEFKKIANFDLGNISKENATLRGTAVFMNLSEEKFTLKDLVLDFSIDGKDIGTIVSKNTKTIQPNSEFSIPVQYTYATKPFIEEGHDPATTYAVQLLGNITVKNADGEEISKPVKFALTYEYLTKKEQRIEEKESRKEERKKRREEKKANQ
jgi:hypothetical protein